MEDQGIPWRKQYEDEERRIEEEYHRSLAEIEESYRKAAEAIRLEFAVKRAEVKKKQYSTSLAVCSTSQCLAINANQSIVAPSVAPQRNILIPQCESDSGYVCRESGADRNNSVKINDMYSIENLIYGIGRVQSTDRSTDLQTTQKLLGSGYETREHRTQCANVILLSIEKLYVVYDPGGSAAITDFMQNIAAYMLATSNSSNV